MFCNGGGYNNSKTDIQYTTAGNFFSCSDLLLELENSYFPNITSIDKCALLKNKCIICVGETTTLSEAVNLVKDKMSHESDKFDLEFEKSREGRNIF
jgi:hypothetical protein